MPLGQKSIRRKLVTINFGLQLPSGLGLTSQIARPKRPVTRPRTTIGRREFFTLGAKAVMAFLSMLLVRSVLKPVVRALARPWEQLMSEGFPMPMATPRSSIFR
jgi:hypothetical protein